MRILITNDDGIFADGMLTLARALEQEHEVHIVAPDTQHSAQSHAITILEPMTIKKQAIRGIKGPAYSVTGTPADCVRVAIEAISTDAPYDLVVSGLNYGLNAGMDVLYSGTVSAAVEANLYGLPSIAASCEVIDGAAQFVPAAEAVNDFIRRNGGQLLEHKILLNMNFPYAMQNAAPLQIAEIGDPIFDTFTLQEDGDEMTLMAKGRKEIQFAENTDRYYLDRNLPTITPIQYNFTHRDWMERLKSWKA